MHIVFTFRIFAFRICANVHSFIHRCAAGARRSIKKTVKLPAVPPKNIRAPVNAANLRGFYVTRLKGFFQKYITSPIGRLFKAFDIRDVFFFCGLPMLGYGIRLKWGDWLAYMVCGGLLFTMGCIMTFAGKK